MYIDKLIEDIKKKNNPSVVGLDTDFSYLPKELQEKYMSEDKNLLHSAALSIYEFNKNIIEGIHELIPAVKIQIAYYEKYGYRGIETFAKTCSLAKKKGLTVIADCKRNDIGSTAYAYAKAYLGSIEYNNKKIRAYDTDCVTANAYLGYDGIYPFLEEIKTNHRGIFILVKTSNPSSGEFQDKIFDDTKKSLYIEMANKVNKWGRELKGKSGYSNVGAVVGATYPEVAIETRKILHDNYLLVPGYGAQGASGKFMKNFFNDDGLGALINSSRGIICAYKKTGEIDYVKSARKSVIDMREDISNNI